MFSIVGLQWSPYVALAIVALLGVATLRSYKRGMVLTVIAALAQTAGWIVFLWVSSGENGRGNALDYLAVVGVVAAFVFPYTVVGCCAGAVIWFMASYLCRRP